MDVTCTMQGRGVSVVRCAGDESVSDLDLPLWAEFGSEALSEAF